jgi:tripartite ATP-independent transporter DctM subunit
MTSAPGTLRRGAAWPGALDAAVGWIVEPLCSALVVIEVIILASGVLARYALHHPLNWSDELSGILLLWLAMLGAAVAYRRREHIRVTALLRVVPPRTAEFFEALSAAIVAMFCVCMLPSTWRLVAADAAQLTPALSLPRSWISAAIVVGLVFILALAIARLGSARLRDVVISVVALCLIAAALYVERGMFAALQNFNLVIFFVVFVGATIAVGVPIAFAFGMSTFGYLAITTAVPVSTVADRMNEGISNLILLAIPLFILLGLLVEASGVAKRLVDAIAALVGQVRGGLNIVLVVAMFIVSGISGSKTADMAAVAPVLFPEMERRGQKRSEMIALLSTSAAMAETIPPSIVLIIVGTVVGLSIKDLFTAGLLPAVITSALLLAVALVRSRNDRAETAPRLPAAAIAKAIFVALPGLLLPFLIRFFVIDGIATTTEVSTVGIVYVILVGIFVYRQFDWRRVYPMLLETSSLAGAILLIVGTATAMAWALTQSGFAQQLADLLAHAPGGRPGFLALSIVAFIILGSVLEGIPAMVLFGPLLFPIATGLGVDGVQYAIVAVLAMGVGLFAPPIGVGFYSACAIGRAPADEAAPRVFPYVIALLVALALIAAFPALSLGFLKR